MSEKNYLAFDLGAESGRAILGTLEDKKLTMEVLHRFPNGMLEVQGHYYWDIYRIFDELRNALINFYKAGNVHPNSIAVDTWGVDFALADRKGNLIGLPYAYRDSRTDGMMDEVFQVLPKSYLYEKTGIAFWQFNSLYQLYAMQREQSPRLEIADRLLFIPDCIHYLFCGVMKTERSFASTSQLYNPVEDRWEASIFDRLGLPLHIMNKLVPSGTLLGKVNDPLTLAAGLKGTEVIAVATHDTASAYAAVPADTDHWVCISSGTWSLMGMESANPIINEKALEYNFTNEAGVDQTTRFLKNIMGLWLLQGCRKAWAEQGKEYSYPDLVEAAREAEAFKILVDPDWQGFYNPDNMLEAIDTFCFETGQEKPESTGSYVRCVMDSLALKYKQVYEQLREVSGKELPVIHIIGGGSRNQELCQYTADATGARVFAGPAEATAIGNLLIQARTLGDVSDLEELRSIVRNSFEIKEYEPRDTEEWDKAFEKFRIQLA